jgi:membrane-associated phospholipid phosphatase
MSSMLFAAGRSRIVLSRRAALRHGLAAALLGLGSSARVSAESTPPPLPGTWRTWLLASPDEIRPAAPLSPSSAELAELRDLQAQRTAEVAATVAKWADELAFLPWTSLALDLITTHRPSPVRAARALALLQIAIYDAVVAAWDAQVAFPRPAPNALDPAIVPLGSVDSGLSAFPSAHAAVAAAASMVLAYAFPDEPAAGLEALADEAATSRLWAGANVRSDVEAGLSIGRAVGTRAVARGKADGSDAIWDGSEHLDDDEFWQPTPPGFVQEPLDPLAGTWRTWVMAGGDQFRPAPPPPHGSAAWHAELAAVQEAIARRTPEQEAAVRFWAGGPGTTTPAGIWTEIARDLVVRGGLDLPHAARVLTLTTVAMADAFVCCWDAKYAYWFARPITADPSLDLLIPTPPFPSYTSGHATVSAAASTLLAHFFPDQASSLETRAVEAKNSRLWAGIHFPIDNDMGAVGGGMVGRLVVERARTDGAE